MWVVGEKLKLSAVIYETIRDTTNDVYVSAATAWEIAIKHAQKRLSFPVDQYDALITAVGFEPLDITATHCLAAGRLPPHHRDPFDRMLIAQASVEGMTLVSADPVFASYGVALLSASG